MPNNSDETVSTKKPRKKYPKTTKKGTKDFTAEEKALILKRATEVGINRAAEEFESSWQAIAAMQREAKANGTLPLAPSRPKGSIAKTEHKTQLIKAVEKIEEAVPVKEEHVTTQNTVTKKAEELKVSVSSDTEKKHSAMEIENAILREKVAVLTEQLEKLRSAVSQLA